MNQLKNLKEDLRTFASDERAKASMWFFKTGKGQYGEGDKFIGVSVPDQRKIAKKYLSLQFPDIKSLLDSEIHEERLTALFILVAKFQKADTALRQQIFKFYMDNIDRVNNWDLVDSSAHKIVGEYLLDKKITLLLSFAKVESMWQRRISIISTFAFLAKGKVEPSYRIADLLLSDREDLIQKAVGWVLRETGKKMGEKVLEEYLLPRYKKMGRTALRYAIERFSKEKRLSYLRGTI